MATATERPASQGKSPTVETVRLATRAPYDWDALHAFLSGRAIPGVEAVGPGLYARTVTLDGRHGTVAVRPWADGAGISVAIRHPDAGAADRLRPRLRRLFDLDADPAAIAAGLAGDPLIAGLVARRPGLRVPGAWDGFETAVRGILGQQVSVTAATRLAGKLAGAFGLLLPSEASRPDLGLTHAFPPPERLADADIARVLNMPRARAAAVRALAAAAVAEPDLLAPGQGLDAALARLTAIRGIGPWTAQYIAMRALSEADALPVGDVGLLRALDAGAGRPTRAGLVARAHAWRPWRAYATVHLWAHDAAKIDASEVAAPPARSIGFESKARDAGERESGEGAASAGVADASPPPPEETPMPVLDRDREGTPDGNARSDPRWAALAARAITADGTFVYSVRTTNVYCRPSCPARPARPANIRFHATPADAEAAGFRPCRRCRPNEASLAERRAAAVARACRAIDAARTPPVLDALARVAGMSPFHFHRVFRAVTGVTPRAYAEARRAERVAAALSGAESVTRAVFEAGYEASSRFYAGAAERLGMSPAAYRRGGVGQTIRFAVGASSLGAILVAATQRGVCAILLGDDPEALVRDLQDRFPHADLVGGDAAFEDLVARVVGLVEAPRTGLDLPLDIGGTAFQQRVWQALRAIPPGATASYADIARAIGAPGAVRAVARACGANPLAVAIPCHRVVRSDGALSGYRWGIDRKRDLLARERDPEAAP